MYKRQHSRCFRTGLATSSKVKLQSLPSSTYEILPHTISEDEFDIKIRRKIIMLLLVVAPSTCQGPGMKPRTGSTKTKIAETVGIIHLYPHMKVSQSFGEFFSGASSPRFHPRALSSELTVAILTDGCTVCSASNSSTSSLAP